MKVKVERKGEHRKKGRKEGRKQRRERRRNRMKKIGVVGKIRERKNVKNKGRR